VRRASTCPTRTGNCEYLTGEQIDEKLNAGLDVVSATNGNRQPTSGIPATTKLP
jgi:hypothetical protein